MNRSRALAACLLLLTTACGSSGSPNIDPQVEALEARVVEMEVMLAEASSPDTQPVAPPPTSPAASTTTLTLPPPAEDEVCMRFLELYIFEVLPLLHQTRLVQGEMHAYLLYGNTKPRNEVLVQDVALTWSIIGDTRRVESGLERLPAESEQLHELGLIAEALDIEEAYGLIAKSYSSLWASTFDPLMQVYDPANYPDPYRPPPSIEISLAVVENDLRLFDLGRDLLAASELCTQTP